MRLAAGFLLVIGALGAQSFSLGVKGGIPLTDAVEGSFAVRSEAKPYTVGPTVEIGLPGPFAFEVDALYRRTGYSSTNTAFGITNVTQVRANSWEFPLLAKYYFSRGGFLARPYLSGGYVVRSLTGAEAVFHNFGTNPITGAPIDSTFRGAEPLADNPTHGAVVGAGVRLNAGLLRIAPEVRYTRWSGRPLDDQGSRGFFARSTQNQVDLLLGLTF